MLDGPAVARRPRRSTGSYYQLKDARNEPKGPQQPHPPICIGGSGEKRTLRITAQYADHWNFVGGTPEEFARKRDVLAAHCADIGRDPKEIMLSAHVRLGEDRDYAKVIEEAAGLGAKGWISRSSTCRRRMTPRFWSRWPTRSRRPDCSAAKTSDGHEAITVRQTHPSRAAPRRKQPGREFARRRSEGVRRR